ncbi:MAG: cyclopropane-fatty-acyl-phospholipid synthase family protein [Acidobacteriota bacterium]
MSSTPLVEDRSLAPEAAGPSAADRIAARVVLHQLAGLQGGAIRFVLPDGAVFRFGDPSSGPSARIEVVRWRAFRRLVTGGDLGAAESFMDGDWSTDDLVAVVRLFVRNADRFDRESPFARVTNWGNRLLHAARRNTLAGSRRNIEAHYDLGNAFYALFLDETMTYSCALFSRPDETLEEAQRNKWRHVAERARLGPGLSVLEIGCGWGGFAAFAAKEYGCRVTGLTLSAEQMVRAKEHARTEGVADLVDVRLSDYRALPEEGRTFDRIVSIEMLEAVGYEYLGRFFATCDALLSREGLAVFQAITVPDHRHDRLLARPDFIKKHVFPGSHVPSLAAITTALARNTTLFVDGLEEIGPHYAETLRRWRTRFLGRRAEAAALGFDERFLKMWEYYLAYCEGGFVERYVNDVQFVLTRSGNRALGRLPAYRGTP